MFSFLLVLIAKMLLLQPTAGLINFLSTAGSLCGRGFLELLAKVSVVLGDLGVALKIIGKEFGKMHLIYCKKKYSVVVKIQKLIF